MEENREKPIGVEIKHLHHAIKRHIDARMAKYFEHVSGTEAFILRFIDRHEGGCVRASDVMEEMRINKSSTSQVLAQLERKGLIDFCEDENDRRKKWVHVSEKGKETCGAMDRALKEIEKEILEGLTEKEITEFRATIGKIHSNIWNKKEEEDS